MVILVKIVPNNVVTVRIILLVISKQVIVNNVQMECMEANANFMNALRIVLMCLVMQRAAFVTTAAIKVTGESIVRSCVHIIASITRVLTRMGHAVVAVLVDIMDKCVTVQRIAFVVGQEIVVGVSTILSMGHFVTRCVVIYV
jgi:hypothetical protein